MMRSARILCAFLCLIVSVNLIAQPAPKPPPAKIKRVITKRTPHRLFVIDAEAGWAVKESENGWKLTLRAPQEVLWFTDRPVRESGYLKASALAGDWQKLFAGAPPNGAVTAPSGPEGKSPSAVTIKAPRYDTKSHELTMLVSTLPGTAAADAAWLGKLTRARAGKNGRVVLFIDDSADTITFNVVAPLNTTFSIDTKDSNCATPYAITDTGGYAGGEGEIYAGTMSINDSGSCDFEISSAFWTFSGDTLELDTSMGNTTPSCRISTCNTDQSGNVWIQAP